MADRENERQYRLVDQLVSMHSCLRDDFHRRSFWLKFGLIGSSIFLCAFVFPSNEVFLQFGVDPEWAKIVLGILSILLLILSTVEFLVGWDDAASLHSAAATRLADLKAEYRKSYSVHEGQNAVENGRLTEQYNRVMREIPAIPDSRFDGLKARHVFKKLLSQEIDRNPKAPAWWLALKLRIEGIWESLSHRKQIKDDRDAHA